MGADTSAMPRHAGFRPFPPPPQPSPASQGREWSVREKLARGAAKPVRVVRERSGRRLLVRDGTAALVGRLAGGFVRPYLGRVLLALAAMGVVALTTAANAW